MTSPLPARPELAERVTADPAGLERFAYQLFSQAAEETPLPPPQAGRLRAAALDPDRLEHVLNHPGQGLSSRSAIPLPYRLWLAHLLWLEDVLHTLAARPTDLTAAELAGLQALARARARFLRTHRFCPHCDAATPRPARRCRRCQQEI